MTPNTPWVMILTRVALIEALAAVLSAVWFIQAYGIEFEQASPDL